jgi:ABC-type amino acid transport substrate-binding protein
MAQAMNKKDPAFVEAVNKALGELKEDGSLDMLEKKWLSE